MLSLLPRRVVKIDITASAGEHGFNFRRQHLIDEIITLNPSATAEFLGRFDEPALEEYFEHLQASRQPRGRESRWVRPSRTPWACTAAACA